MPSSVSAPSLSTPTPWVAAARLIARWLDRRERLDALLESLPATFTGPERARCQHLVIGVVRHFGRIDAALGRLVAHPPRFATRAILCIAGYELIVAAADGDTGRIARIVHHGVEQAGVEIDPRTNVKANTLDYKTSVAKVFSAGDMRRGQSLVVWAIREGRQCARAIDEFLMGTTTLPR